MQSGETPKKPILPVDFEEFLAERERDIKKPPVPPKRRQPKITRNMSSRMRTVMSQTPNTVRAIYVPEHDRNMTPTNDDLVGTHEVGPGDVHNSNVSWRTGKPTTEAATGYAKKTYRKGSTGRRGRPPSQDFDSLLAEFDDI